MSENKNIKTESRTESRNHIFNIIFQNEFQTFSELEGSLNTYYDVLDDEFEMEQKSEASFYRPQPDKKFIKDYLWGVSENLEEIDNNINDSCVGWSVSRIAKVELAILRLAVYEILFREDIPDAVAINEAVELAKKYSSEKSPSFINGVLGKIAKQKEVK